MKTNRPTRHLRLLPLILLAALLGACASIGRPDGGARDETPPVFVRSDPAPGALNFKGSRIAVVFDENITLDDPSNKIVVSPPQKQPPRISSNARRVNIELIDTLLPDVTYTIDFADAVRDLNESNVLDGFSLDFSTGPELDTLSISGMVFAARNLEPAQGMIVGVYSAAGYADTTITTLPLERITKTNQLGQFTVRNLKPGPYRIFAVNDLNRDYHWDRSEDVAFLDVELIPRAEPAEYTDTVASSTGRDSVVIRAGTRFLPDDVLLTWFNENYSPRYLVKNERPERNRLSLIFSAPADSLPSITVDGGRFDGADLRRLGVTEASRGLDSITVWLADTAMIALDSLRVATRYQFTDSLDRMVWRTDTLSFNMRGAKKSKKDKKRAEEPDTVALDSLGRPVITDFINFRPASGNDQDLHLGLTFTSATPVAAIDPAGIRMEMMTDTVWTPAEAPAIVLTDSLNPRNFSAAYTWRPATRYRLTIDSAMVTDIYGLHNKPIVHEFTTRSPEDYSALFFTVTGLPDSTAAVVELLRGDDLLKTAPVVDGTATLEYLEPGSYYARLFIDSDGDGKWTNGSMAGLRQPEEVYYYPRKLTLKKNWDIEQTWNINETPVDLQKPDDIKKNKPKRKAGDPNEKPDTDAGEETDELWDTYSRDPFFQNPAATRRR